MNTNDEEHCKTLLQWISQNEKKVKILRIGGYCGFTSSIKSNYSRLGIAIGENSHLKTELVDFRDDLYKLIPMNVFDTIFFEGLKQNTSIHELIVKSSHRISQCVHEVFNEILKANQNNRLTNLQIESADLRQYGIDNVVADTLRYCSNLKRIVLWNCNMNDELLLPMITAIRGHSMIEKLKLERNGIENVGCTSLSALLADANCRLRVLDLSRNNIGAEGAITLANSLVNNTSLEHLNLLFNQIDREVYSSVEDAFDRSLCNTTSINSTYTSNHSLKSLVLSVLLARRPQLCDSLYINNKGSSRSQVAIKKILLHHSPLDMKPLFEWNVDDDQQSLKSLPFLIDWFKKVNEINYICSLNSRKLDAIYQYAKAMSYLFVPATHHINGGDKKRKREGGGGFLGL